MKQLNKSKQNLEEKYKLVADTIRLYPNQLKQAWDEISFLNLPNDYKNVDNIVFCGMGGSALGARMVDSYAFGKLRIPFEIFNFYKTPNYVNKNTLVIASSYSGTTEEIVEATYDALNKKAKLIIVTTGGKLEEIVKKDKIPAYIFDPSYNPSKQPRMSIGYAFGATLSLISKLGFINVSEDEISKTLNDSFNILTEYHENAPKDKNLAYSYASSIKGKIPILVASEHLFGTVHTIKNQFNESAKTFSTLFELPELNHHLMEGLTNPIKQKEILKFIFFSSKLYHERVQERYPITQKVLEKNRIDYLSYNVSSETKLSQVFETLIFGSFVVYFLTKLYEIDPMEIPWVDYFKKELTKK